MRAELEESLRYALAKLDPAALVLPQLPSSPPSLILAIGKAALPMLQAARHAFPAAEWLAVAPGRQHTCSQAPPALVLAEPSLARTQCQTERAWRPAT